MFKRKKSKHSNLKEDIKETQEDPVNYINDGQADFISALANFSLAHMEITSYLTVRKIQETAEKSSNLASISEETSAIAQEIMASVEQINLTMHNISSEVIESMSELEQLKKIIADISESFKDTLNKSKALEFKVESISEINSDISSIARQTNLLSLNAMIESARAGDAGKGFSVVASEVRKLSDKTKEAVNKVDQISEAIVMETIETSDTLNNVRNDFDEYVTGSLNFAQSVKESFIEIGEATKLIDDIANVIKQQSQASEEIAKVSEELHSSTDFGSIISTNTDNLIKIIIPLLKISDGQDIIAILSQRMIDHANYLRNIIRSNSKSVKLSNHNQCAFGKWYNANKEKYSYIQEFKDMDIPHRRFHEASIKFVENGTIESIENLLDTSTDILKYFIRLVLFFINKNY